MLGLGEAVFGVIWGPNLGMEQTAAYNRDSLTVFAGSFFVIYLVRLIQLKSVQLI